MRGITGDSVLVAGACPFGHVSALVWLWSSGDTSFPLSRSTRRSSIAGILAYQGHVVCSFGMCWGVRESVLECYAAVCYFEFTRSIASLLFLGKLFCARGLTNVTTCLLIQPQRLWERTLTTPTIKWPFPVFRLVVEGAFAFGCL